MEKELNNKEMKELFSTIASFQTEGECKKFLRDVCTLSELKAMSERWQVAKQLEKGVPYRTIAKKTGSSTATITRVAHWLHHGAGGYRVFLERMK